MTSRSLKKITCHGVNLMTLEKPCMSCRAWPGIFV